MVVVLLLVATTFQSIDVISTFRCREEKQVKIYKTIILDLHRLKDLKKKKLTCSTDSFFKKYIMNEDKLERQNETYNIRYNKEKFTYNFQAGFVPTSRKLK